MDIRPFPGLERGTWPRGESGSLWLPKAVASETLVIRMDPGEAGLFRYLLEGAGGHLALLTVLDPKAALLKLVFSPHQREELFRWLGSLRDSLSFEIVPLP